MERQQQIDWTRAEQLGLLRDAIVSPRRQVSGAVQKAVLRSIDDHGRGGEAWLGYERIAAEAGCSVRTAKRAVQALTDASLICVDTRRSASGVVCNHYRIVWSELALLRRILAHRPVPDRSAMVSDRSAMVSDRSAMVSDRSAMVSRPECHHGTQTAPEAHQKRTEPPPQSPSAGGGWPELIAEWRSRIGQIGQLAGEAAHAGEAAEAFACRLEAAWRTATHPANARTITRPAGSVVYFLRTRCWPAEGVVDPADAVAAQAAVDYQTRTDQERQRRTARRHADQLARQASTRVRQLRRGGVSDERIAAELAREFAPEVLAAIGWTVVSQETKGVS